MPVIAWRSECCTARVTAWWQKLCDWSSVQGLMWPLAHCTPTFFWQQQTLILPSTNTGMAVIIVVGLQMICNSTTVWKSDTGQFSITNVSLKNIVSVTWKQNLQKWEKSIVCFVNALSESMCRNTYTANRYFVKSQRERMPLPGWWDHSILDN